MNWSPNQIEQYQNLSAKRNSGLLFGPLTKVYQDLQFDNKSPEGLENRLYYVRRLARVVGHEVDYDDSSVESLLDLERVASVAHDNKKLSVRDFGYFLPWHDPSFAGFQEEAQHAVAEYQKLTQENNDNSGSQALQQAYNRFKLDADTPEDLGARFDFLMNLGVISYKNFVYEATRYTHVEGLISLEAFVRMAHERGDINLDTFDPMKS